MFGYEVVVAFLIADPKSVKLWYLVIGKLILELLKQCCESAAAGFQVPLFIQL
mgnify:CR=1 FL=1